jgi:predicted metal-dependent hydrolase
MIFLLIHHTVEDYDKWKVAYDVHEETRIASGIKEKYVLRNIDNMNEVTILFEVADLSKSKEFINSSDLSEAMHSAGVVSKPDFSFLEG